jgi:hypothetical protein
VLTQICFSQVAVAVGVLALVSLAAADFWQEYDEKFMHHINEEMELYIKHKQEKYAFRPHFLLGFLPA